MSRQGPDGTLAVLVDVVNSLSERQADGPSVILTLGGLIVSGVVIPSWQWYEEVEEDLREAYVRSGGDPASEDAGWAMLFKEVGQKVAQQDAEKRVAMEAGEGLAERYRRALGRQDITTFIHLKDARVFTPGQEGMPRNGMYWRGRLSQLAGWAFGLLEPAT